MTVTPMVFLTIVTSCEPASAAPLPAAPLPVAPGRRSTWTASWSIRPSRVRCSWKCGDSTGMRMMSSSIWVG